MRQLQTTVCKLVGGCLEAKPATSKGSIYIYRYIYVCIGIDRYIPKTAHLSLRVGGCCLFVCNSAETFAGGGFEHSTRLSVLSVSSVRGLPC